MPVVRNNARAGRPSQRVVRNFAYVTARKRRARWSALIGFACLGSTFWLALDPSRILLAYGLMLGGYILFSYGLRELAKWNARNDVRLDVLLKGLGDRYTLVHYAQVDKRVIEHLLIHPGGVLVLTAKELAGTISYRNGRWRKRAAGFGRLLNFGGPQLGDPSRETQASVDALSALLTEAGIEVEDQSTQTAEAGLRAEVDGAIVFVNPQVVLDVEEPDFPVTNGEGLPDFVRTLPAASGPRTANQQALLGLLTGGKGVEQPVAAPRRRPVKRRAA